MIQFEENSLRFWLRLLCLILYRGDALLTWQNTLNTSACLLY